MASICTLRRLDERAADARPPVNDERTDNWFERDLARFGEIEEDVPASHLLVSDYDTP